ncbi:caspase family protein [Kosakonia radicincitans]|uniref:caspase family protein n=1 Tax=Kosakonia radicincitans TaxID=283686 RepID=UPI00068BF751|nr:caspase family protein [Kosakonia radicincitans]
MVDLCLTIGVSRAEHLPELPGAITAAHEMSEWAKQSGFITEMITDEGNNSVTIARIREKLLSMLPENDEVNLFILHFAGHGFRTGAEQNVWLPTDWYQEMRAISVEGLKRQLYRHGIKNLSIFSDACRTLPGDIENADIAEDPILPRGPYEPTPPIIDRFNAVMDGKQAYMLQGDNQSPPRCIFSSVLIEGLCGLHEDAFDEYIPDCVIPESLALFSQKRMKQIGNLYRLTCTPDSSTGIPRQHTIYFERGRQLLGNIIDLRWPAPPESYNKNTNEDSHSEWSNEDSDDIPDEYFSSPDEHYSSPDSYNDKEYFDIPLFLSKTEENEKKSKASRIISIHNI